MTPNSDKAEIITSLPFWRHIRWQLSAAFILIALVPVIIVAFITNSLAEAQAETQIFRQLDSVADLKRDHIRGWVNASTATLNNFLSIPVQRAIITTVTAPSPAAQEQLNSLLAAVTVAPAGGEGTVRFTQLFVYTPAGKIVASSNPARVGQVVSFQPYFTDSLTANHIQAPFYAVGSSQLVMVVTQRVVDERGQLVAVLGGHLDLAVLGQIMVGRTGLGTSGETYLVSRESYYLLTPSRFEGYPLTQAYRSEGIDQGLTGKNGDSTYLNYRDPPELVMGVFRWVPELQAVLMAEITRTEAMAAAQQSRRLSFVVVLATIIGGLLFGLLVASRIARPITLLTETAARIAGGALEQRVTITQRNEIGVLAQVFNIMTSRLNTTLANLEQRIADRTVDLQQALNAREQTLADLNNTIQAREALQATLEEMSSPVLPVLDGVLVMPLIGMIEGQRANLLTGTLLSAVERYRAQVIILDVTGVPLVDTQVAHVLLQAAAAARLLGATPVLVGLHPELAQTIVGLGVDLSAVITKADLQTGINYAATLMQGSRN